MQPSDGKGIGKGVGVVKIKASTNQCERWSRLKVWDKKKVGGRKGKKCGGGR